MLTLLFALAAIGQEQVTDPGDRDDIVVEGRKLPTKKEALRTVTDMTVIVESQIARFHQRICPLVVGMQPQAAAIVEERIRKTATAVGARLDKARCEPNLILLIAGDGASLFKDLRSARPKWFMSLSGPEKRRLERESPVRAWQTIVNRTPTGGIWWASNFANETFFNIEGSAIIIDADAIEGLSLRQVADYTVMRGLAYIRPPASVGQLNSILSIFARPKASGPRELTAFDRRYLSELYTHLDRKGFDSSVHERQRLARAISQTD